MVINIYIVKTNFNNIFKDDIQSKLFARQGYVSMPFLIDKEVESLKSLISSVKMPDIDLFHSQINNDYSLNQQYNHLINTFIEPHPSKLNLTDNYKIIISVFINKLPSKNTTFEIHTDDSLCDERYFTPVNIWIPLIDVNSDNCTICISKGSHHNTLTLRSHTIPDSYIEKNKDSLKQSCLPVEIRKGEALIYSPACVHLSHPNYSQANKPVVALALIPAQAELCCFSQKKRIFMKNQVFKYNLTIDELLNKTDFSLLDCNEIIIV